MEGENMIGVVYEEIGVAEEEIPVAYCPFCESIAPIQMSLNGSKLQGRCLLCGKSLGSVLDLIDWIPRSDFQDRTGLKVMEVVEIKTDGLNIDK
jgi:hypothetical protein